MYLLLAQLKCLRKLKVSITSCRLAVDRQELHICALWRITIESTLKFCLLIISWPLRRSDRQKLTEPSVIVTMQYKVFELFSRSALIETMTMIENWRRGKKRGRAGRFFVFFYTWWREIGTAYTVNNLQLGRGDDFVSIVSCKTTHSQSQCTLYYHILIGYLVEYG